MQWKTVRGSSPSPSAPIAASLGAAKAGAQAGSLRRAALMLAAVFQLAGGTSTVEGTCRPTPPSDELGDPVTFGLVGLVLGLITGFLLACCCGCCLGLFGHRARETQLLEPHPEPPLQRDPAPPSRRAPCLEPPPGPTTSPRSPRQRPASPDRPEHRLRRCWFCGQDPQTTEAGTAHSGQTGGQHPLRAGEHAAPAGLHSPDVSAHGRTVPRAQCAGLVLDPVFVSFGMQ